MDTKRTAVLGTGSVCVGRRLAACRRGRSWPATFWKLGVLPRLTVACVALALAVGCDVLEDVLDAGGGDSAYLVGADGEHVFYSYTRSSDAECNDWGFCDYPVSLWSFDIATGKSRRIQRPVFQCNAQAFGDYFVAERFYDDDSERVEAVQISTGQRTTVATPGPAPDLPCEQHMLDGERVMVLRPGELLLFDLAAKSVIWTFDVPAGFNRLTALAGDYVVVSSIGAENYDWYADLLISVATSETIDIPPPPDGIELYEDQYYYAGLSTGWLAADGWRGDGQDGGFCILGFHLSTQTWHVVIGPDAPVPSDWDPSLLGVTDGSFVIAWDRHPPERFFSEGIVRLDFVDAETGDTRVVSDDLSALALLYDWPDTDENVQIYGNNVYWIDEMHMSGRVAILDLDTGRLQTHQLGGPFED